MFINYYLQRCNILTKKCELSIWKKKMMWINTKWSIVLLFLLKHKVGLRLNIQPVSWGTQSRRTLPLRIKFCHNHTLHRSGSQSMGRGPLVGLGQHGARSWTLVGSLNRDIQWSSRNFSRGKGGFGEKNDRIYIGHLMYKFTMVKFLRGP